MDLCLNCFLIAHIHDSFSFRCLVALNEALKEEIQHLKVLTGQAIPNGGPMMNYASYGANQQYYPNNQAMHTLLTAQQFQQLQIQSQKQPQHQTGDMGVRGPVPTPNHKDASSDGSLTASKD